MVAVVRRASCSLDFHNLSFNFIYLYNLPHFLTPSESSLDIYMNVNCSVAGVTTQISCNSSQPTEPSPAQDSQQWQDWYTRSTHLSSVLCLGQNQTNKNPAWQPLVSLLRLLAPSFRNWRCGEWKTGTNECIKLGTRYPNNHSVYLIWILKRNAVFSFLSSFVIVG